MILTAGNGIQQQQQQQTVALLWLTAVVVLSSSSSQSDKQQLWVHGMFFFQVAGQVQQRHQFAAVAKAVPHSCWLALLIATILQELGGEGESGKGLFSQRLKYLPVLGFALSLGTMAMTVSPSATIWGLIRPYLGRTEQQQQSLHLVALNNNIQQQQYYQRPSASFRAWTPVQVGEWLVQAKGVQSQLVEEFLYHQLSGSQVSRLPWSDWQTLNLPLGVTMRIYDAVHDELQQRQESRGWLEELDQHLYQDGSHKPSNNCNLEEIQEEGHDRVQAIMKERFGSSFELPLPRTQEDPVSAATIKEKDQPSPTAMGSATTEVSAVRDESHRSPPVAAQHPPPTVVESNSNTFFQLTSPASIPPHIADIMQRKPDLVQAILQTTRRKEKAEDTYNPDERTALLDQTGVDEQQQQDERPADLLRRRR